MRKGDGCEPQVITGDHRVQSRLTENVPRWSPGIQADRDVWFVGAAPVTDGRQKRKDRRLQAIEKGAIRTIEAEADGRERRELEIAFWPDWRRRRIQQARNITVLIFAYSVVRHDTTYAVQQKHAMQ